jgi:hypothetical protein
MYVEKLKITVEKKAGALKYETWLLVEGLAKTVSQIMRENIPAYN